MNIVHVMGPRTADCPECGSTDTHQTAPASPLTYTTYACGDCGHEWRQVVPEPNDVWDGWDD